MVSDLVGRARPRAKRRASGWTSETAVFEGNLLSVLRRKEISFIIISMRFLLRLLFSLFSNFVALWVAVYFVSGFQIAGDYKSFLLAAAVLTLINAFIRPILKILFTPIIFLTFGLAALVVNAIVLYLLDKLLPNITITDILSLVYATLIITAVNLVINFAAKRTYK